MAMRLMEGRNLRFSDGDGTKPPFAVVVDEAFAHAFFPGQDVIGRTFANGTDGRVPPAFRIVGLVSSAKYRSLREVPPPTFYSLPYWLSGTTGMLNLNVRAYGDPVSVVGEVRRAIKEMNSRVPIVEVTTMKQEVRNSLWQERLLLLMTVFFGAAGLLLASIGLYGALAQAVAQSKRDIGIRMALGARVRHIIKAVGWPQFVTVSVAAVCGFAVSSFALRLAGPFLYKVSRFDPISYGFAIVLIAVVALLAALAPILRATRIDPAAVLRSE